MVGYLGFNSFFCFDSLNSCCLLSFVPVVPIKSYSNAEADKDKILSDNKNKSGIYMWKIQSMVNAISEASFAGSARKFV